MITFQEIKFGSPAYEQECQLRHAVLRVPLGLNLFAEDLRSEGAQRHFGLFDEGALVACLVAVPLSPTSAKLRQMAVRADRQKRGLGAQLLRNIESRLAAAGIVDVCLHARRSAVGFYATLGYTAVGEPFLEIGLPHLRMEKTLPPPMAPMAAPAAEV